MARYVATVRTRTAVADAFAYMADLRNFADWDPGVRNVVQVEGDGPGPGAVFDVTLSSRRSRTFRYRTVEYTQPRGLLVVAETATLRSTDRIVVRPDLDGTLVTYDAELSLKGPMRLAAPLFAVAFRRIGDRAAAGLCRVLDGEVHRVDS
ncbi:MAG TPA: SRPBCC family protein [Ilumatobacteraceae bacterium]|nr:SRPBCC family protein [Ilumatobacteraceae bacterium]